MKDTLRIALEITQEELRKTRQAYFGVYSHLKAIQTAYELGNDSAMLQFAIQIGGILEENKIA